MIPIPAIDLKNGKVVRLLHGDFTKEKIYDVEPADIAKAYAADGAQRLHVVDLDGAVSGHPKNWAGVEQILRAVKVPVEIGGGIRSIETALKYIKAGASYVIFGTKACLDTGFVREAAHELKEKMIVGIDAKNGFVATDGWVTITQIKAMDLARDMKALGVKSLIYTDISKDGALEGPNLDAVARIADAVDLHVIASGGVGSLSDLEQLVKLNRHNITGVIIGKALYEKKFTVKEAVRVCSQSG